ncbi:hypothetical protein D9M71_543460 [compost metagenome]
MQQWERQFSRVERLQGQVQHHCTVLTDGVEHYRVLTLSDHFSHDVNALGLKTLQVRQHVFPPSSALGRDATENPMPGPVTRGAIACGRLSPTSF